MKPVSDFIRNLLLFTICSPAFASSLAFTSPACGQAVSGAITIAAVESQPTATRVQFFIGSHRLGASSAPAYSIGWNSFEAMDGVSAIQAVATDALGNKIDTAECLVQVSNLNVSLVVNSPDLTQTLSGVVTVSMTGADPLAFPAVWTLNIDGEEQSTVWTDNTWQSPLTVAFSLDTTRFSNGPHELHVSMNSRSGPSQPQWVNWRGMVNRVIQLNNGNAWMDVAPTSQSLYMKPGDQVNVGCSRLFTDLTSGPCTMPIYSSDTPSVAAVDTLGTVTALQNGFAQIQIQDGAKTTTARVNIATDSRVPHFAGDGEILTGYDPRKSLFVIAPFFLDADNLSQNSSLWEEVVRAGINTLSFGAYTNPRDTTVSFPDWQTNFDSTVGQKFQWAEQNGFHLLLTGDDIFRNIGTDAWYTLNWPFGQQAVQYAVNQLSATGVGIGIEGIDEASSIWGPRPVPIGLIGQAPYLFNEVDCLSGTCTVNWLNNPVPNNWVFAFEGSSNALLNNPAGTLFTAVNSLAGGYQFQAPVGLTGSFTTATDPLLEYQWFAGNYCGNNSACNPQVPNNALSRMAGWIKSAAKTVPLTFPPIATDAASVFGSWMGPGSISDYASNYFTSLKTRTTYPWTEGIQEMVSSMNQSFFARQPLLMLNRPQLMLVSLAGPSYTKGPSASATFVAGVDSLSEPGVSPAHVSAVMMNAAALGGAGIRLYYFEPPPDNSTRAVDTSGTSLQTGANPTTLQVASWHAMGYAANLLTGVLQPFLLNSALNAPAYGRNINAAVRQNAGGMMLLIVNGNDWARTVNVDFTPYPHSFGIARYITGATGIATSLLPGSTQGEPLTLAAGQTVAYIFPGSAAAMPLRNAVLSPQTSDGATVGLQYAYVYPTDLNDAPVISCASQCTIARDLRIGDIFYRFVLPGALGVTATRELPGLGRH